MLATVAMAALLLAAGPAVAEDTPTLVRDVKTGRYLLGTLDPKKPEGDYVQPDTQIEPSVAVNPANPDNVVAVYQEGRIDSGGDATNGYATSFDGGKTWKFGELPGLTTFPGQNGPFERASDAVVAFGPDNLVYANSLVFDKTVNNGTRSAMAVNVSKDGGRTWGPPVFFQDDNIGGTNDKNWIVVDLSEEAGHHYGRVYVVWDRIAPVVYDYCDHDCDKLENWLPNLQTVSGLVFAGQGLGAYPIVTKSGGLGMALTMIQGALPISPLVTDQPDLEEVAEEGQESFIYAPAAGTTPWPAPLQFLPPVEIAINRSAGTPAQRGPDGIPSAVANRKTGTLHVVWDDARGRSDGANDVVISSSTDDGTTWSAPQPVSPGPRDNHVNHYGASIDSGPDGTLHIAYRTRNQGEPFSPYIDSYYQQSRDDGKTWSAPLKINLQTSDMRYGAFSRGGTFEGDYDQIATIAKSSYFVRCQGAPEFPGEPATLSPAEGGRAMSFDDELRGHQHQSCWVALIKDLPPGSSVDVPAPTPPAAGGSTTAKPLRLTLTRRRLPGRRLRVRLGGAIRGAVSSVSFYVGKRRIGRDSKPPFEHVVTVVRRHSALVVRAVVVLSDGRRVTLRRTLVRRSRS